MLNINTVTKKITVDLNEKLVDYIAGILQIRGLFELRGIAWFGVKNISRSENAIVITNKHLWFVTVPLPGADKIIGRTDIGMWQWFSAKKDIENKLKETLSTTKSLQEVLEILHSTSL